MAVRKRSLLKLCAERVIQDIKESSWLLSLSSGWSSLVNLSTLLSDSVENVEGENIEEKGDFPKGQWSFCRHRGKMKFLKINFFLIFGNLYILGVMCENF